MVFFSSFVLAFELASSEGSTGFSGLLEGGALVLGTLLEAVSLLLVGCCELPFMELSMSFLCFLAVSLGGEEGDAWGAGYETGRTGD